jgi:uncharacterized DUF497 family protein
LKYYDWDNEKNEALKNERNISFEEVVYWINNGGLMEVIKNPNNEKYSHQSVFVMCMNNYVYYVPFVEDAERYFLKTIYPSRKATNTYLGKRGGQNEIS